MTKYFKVSKKAAALELNIIFGFIMTVLVVLAGMLATASWMDYHKQDDHGAALLFCAMILVPVGPMWGIFSLWKERRKKLAAIPDEEAIVIKYSD